MTQAGSSDSRTPLNRTPLDYNRSVSTQNHRGEWVPAIPGPFLGFRKKCDCGAKFWTLRGYEGHYARDHILGKD
jgi:hypothetical protein